MSNRKLYPAYGSKVMAGGIPLMPKPVPLKNRGYSMPMIYDKMEEEELPDRSPCSSRYERVVKNKTKSKNKSPDNYSNEGEYMGNSIVLSDESSETVEFNQSDKWNSEGEMETESDSDIFFDYEAEERNEEDYEVEESNKQNTRENKRCNMKMDCCCRKCKLNNTFIYSVVGDKRSPRMYRRRIKTHGVDSRVNPIIGFEKNELDPTTDRETSSEGNDSDYGDT
jgi:hypothetical protein